MSSKIRCAAAALALLLLLSAGAAHARPPRRPAASFESLWQWVVSGWASLWTKEGGEMDPNGLVTPLPPTEAGSDMDPNG